MPRNRDSGVELLIKLPWWVSACLGVVIFTAMRWIYPAMVPNRGPAAGLVLLSTQLAPVAGGFFILIAGISALFSWRRRALVDSQSGLQSLRSVSWKEFEWMIAEAYRRKGYSVSESLGGGADGGIDVVLRKEGRMTLVQCKQWKTSSVGVPTLREIWGLVSHHQAHGAIVVTSGKFTGEAAAFAEGKPIELIDGPNLLELVRSVQPNEAAPNVSRDVPSAVTCPKCGSAMVQRVARRGANAGNSFYGCSQYPRCSGVRNMS